MGQFTLYLEGQELTAQQTVLAADSIDYITGSLVCTKDWDGAEITVRIEQGETRYAIPVIDRKIPEDAHLNLRAGLWKVWAIGDCYEGDELVSRITSTVSQLRVEQSGALGGDPLPEIPSSYAEAILGKSANAEAIAQSVRDDADSGLFNGTDGADGITPTIGENGNWYLGSTDTGKPSRGAQGQPGAPGQSGVYVGADPIPTGFNVQIDPNGDADELVEEAPNDGKEYVRKNKEWTEATGGGSDTDYDMVISIQSTYDQIFAGWSGALISGSVQNCIDKITDSAPYGVAKVLVVLSAYYYDYILRGNIPISVAIFHGGTSLVCGSFALPYGIAKHIAFVIQENGYVDAFEVT